MNTPEQIKQWMEDEAKIASFIISVDEELKEEILLVLKTSNGVISYHKSLASVASNKKEFLSHIQEIDSSMQKVEDFFIKQGVDIKERVSVMETIKMGTGKLGFLKLKATKFNLIGD